MSIQVTYKLNPPQGVQTDTSATASFSADSPAYSSAGLREIQAKLNDSLTVWKEAIGDLEKSREDPGEVGYGQGKASRMHREENAGAAEIDGESSEEDGEEA